MIRRFFRSIIRTSAFLGKEIAEILRQPRLILTLVLGPFLILLLFGIGYRNQARSLRTLFVVPSGSPMEQQVQQYASSLGPQLIFMGITPDEATARARLRANQVDVVVLVPGDAYKLISNNQQATFTLLHNEIDPLQVDYIRYFGQVYVDEVNRRVLETAMQQGQGDAGNMQSDIKAARDNAAALHQALQAGDTAAAGQHQQALNQNVSALEAAAGVGAGLLGGVRQTVGGGSSQAPSSTLQGSVAGIRQDTNDLGQPGAASTGSSQLQKVTKLENDLSQLDSEISQFRQMDPRVLVQPFSSDTRSVATVQPSLSDYFAPSVVVLLMQHLAITFAALSIVRERRLGAMELFRVSPISAMETLLGKYLSYLVFASVLAAILTGLVVFALKVPMLGAWGHYALVLLALIFTSLGVGFVISLVSQTDSQAVQYAMIVLLSSVFFSGFMLSLQNLIQPVRLVSWLLPATYGISLLQDVMLRGVLTQPLLLGVLFAIGVALFVVAWALLNRRMARA